MAQLRPSNAAHLTHNDLQATGLASDAVPMDLPRPDAAFTGPFHGFTIDSSFPNPPPLDLMKKEGATVGYALDTLQRNHKPKKLAYNRGHVFFGFVAYKRINATTFRAPDPGSDDVQRVVVKRINKATCAAQGRLQTVYQDVAVMDRIGDNEHVLRHLDFLEDEEFLYIITPEGQGTLKDRIPWHSDEMLPEHETHTIFIQLLKILDYLAKHNVNHHDLSPDNLLYLTDDKIVLFDMEFSLLMPTVNGQRTFMRPQGNGGTQAFQCPEVFANQVPFDGCAMDLFAVAHTFYNLITNRLLYRLPVPADISYRFFVMERGLDIRLNERLIEILEDVDGETYEVFENAVECINRLSPPARALLQRMLQHQPQDRPSLAQVMQAEYTQGAD